ncbi:MAG: ParA family protein [bacterium]
MARIISVVNQKGGVGKTTTAVNFAACLGVLEKRVLLVDMDPQGNATSMSSIKDDSFNTVYDTMTDHSKNAVYDTELPFLKIMPSDAELTGAEVELPSLDNGEYILREVLDKMRDDFDYIIIDSPPALNILTVNNMTASDGIIIPIQCEYFALEGVSRITGTYEKIKSMNPEIEIDGILLTMYDRRLRLTFEVESDVRGFFGESVFKTVIPRNVKLTESPSYGCPIIMYDMASVGAECYMEMAKEYLERRKKREK